MKRILVRAAAAAAALSIVVTTAFAAGPGAGRRTWGAGGSRGCAGQYCAYTDADGDGVCDYAGQYCHYVDADGDGICDYAGQHCSCADADGDGVCDACGRAFPAAGTGLYSRHGGAHHAAGRRGHGCRGGACG